ncbi:hypothetical protein AAMO2058_001603600 [Amorphochlora amoebiformis]
MPAKFGANCIGDLEENEPLVHKQQPLADHGFHNLKGGASSTFSDLKVEQLADPEEKKQLVKDMNCLAKCTAYSFCCCLCTGGLICVGLLCYRRHLLKKWDKLRARNKIPVSSNSRMPATNL